jgi:hypothetical protein
LVAVRSKHTLIKGITTLSLNGMNLGVEGATSLAGASPAQTALQLQALALWQRAATMSASVDCDACPASARWHAHFSNNVEFAAAGASSWSCAAAAVAVTAIAYAAHDFQRIVFWQGEAALDGLLFALLTIKMHTMLERYFSGTVPWPGSSNGSTGCACNSGKNCSEALESRAKVSHLEIWFWHIAGSMYRLFLRRLLGSNGCCDTSWVLACVSVRVRTCMSVCG